MFLKDESKSTINFAENFEPQCYTEKLQADSHYASKLTFWQMAYKNQSRKLESLRRERNEQLILLSGQIMFLESQIAKRDEERSQLLYMKNKIIDEQQMRIEDLLFQVESMTTKKHKKKFFKQTQVRNNQKVLNGSDDSSSSSVKDFNSATNESESGRRKMDKYINGLSSILLRIRTAFLKKCAMKCPKNTNNEINVTFYETKLNNITMV